MQNELKGAIHIRAFQYQKDNKFIGCACVFRGERERVGRFPPVMVCVQRICGNCKFTPLLSIQNDNKPTPQDEVLPQQCDYLVTCSLSPSPRGNPARNGQGQEGVE